MKHRVFLFGLDGASWNVLDRMIAAGHMPHLEKLCTDGVRATLHSTVPPITPVAWSSLMTGVNPGQHGIYGFMKKSEQDGPQTQLANRMLIKTPTIFDYYAEGGRVISLNLPMSYPATEINGIMVTGMMTPMRNMGDFESPRGLLDKLRREGIDYVIDPRMDEPEDVDADQMYEDWRDAGSLFVKKLVRIASNRMRAAHYLLDREAWEVFICVLVGTDRLQHIYWDRLMPDDGSAPDPVVAEYYRQVDNHLDSVLQKLAPEDTLLIVSDHGFTKLHGDFLTNEWLRRQGWLVRRQASKSLRYSMKLFLNKLGITRAKLSRFVNEKKISKLQLTASHIDWASSTAFLSSPFGIRINLRGRQPLGAVPPEQFETTRDAIISALGELRDSHGQPMMQNIYRSEDLYSGEACADAPDIVFGFRDDLNYAAYHGEIGGELFKPARGKTGDHRVDGICVAYGGGIASRPEELTFHIRDILPTLMHLNGRAVPAICDGRVLTEILTDPAEVRIDPDWQRFCPEKRSVHYDQDQADEITERLKALGYVADD